MNSNENVRNAFLVVLETYKSINKLMDLCKVIADESGYKLVYPNFLRFKSDREVSGWLITYFIMLFQRKDIDIPNDNVSEAPIFVLEINLKDLPEINISKFEFSDTKKLPKYFSPTDHWRFFNPIRNKVYMVFEESEHFNVATPKPGMEDDVDKYYYGLKRAITIKDDLLSVTADNLNEKIFERFTYLSSF